MAATTTGFINICPDCGANSSGMSNFCTGCGTALSPVNAQPSPATVINNSPHHVAARGFGQVFGIHPILAIFTITVDAMVSLVDVSTLGITAPYLWLIASIFVGVIVFLGQKKWYGEDAESALIKALILAFLTALPTPLPSFLTVPSGILGTVQLLRNKD